MITYHSPLRPGFCRPHIFFGSGNLRTEPIFLEVIYKRNCFVWPPARPETSHKQPLGPNQQHQTDDRRSLQVLFHFFIFFPKIFPLNIHLFFNDSFNGFFAKPTKLSQRSALVGTCHPKWEPWLRSLGSPGALPLKKLLSRFRGECNRAVGFFIRPGFCVCGGPGVMQPWKHTYDQFFFLGDDHFERNLAMAIVHVAEFSRILFGLIFSATVPLWHYILFCFGYIRYIRAVS